MSANEFAQLTRSDNGVATLTLNSPPFNLFTISGNQQFDRVLDEIANDESIRVVVVTGAGEKAFSAGSDIKKFESNVKNGTLVSDKLEFECFVFDKLADLPQPTIAAINGVSLGGGAELTLCCDYSIIAENAKIGFTEIKIGLFPGSGGLVRLPKLVGHAKAKELMFFGEMLSGKEAFEIGLVNEVISDDQLLDRAYERANQLAKLPQQSLRAIKQAVNDISEMPHSQGIHYSLELARRVFSSEDAIEGVDAFINKRDPKFK